MAEQQIRHGFSNASYSNTKPHVALGVVRRWIVSSSKHILVFARVGESHCGRTIGVAGQQMHEVYNHQETQRRRLSSRGKQAD